MNYAGFFVRFFAFVVDWVILGILGFVLRGFYSVFYNHSGLFVFTDQESFLYLIGIIIPALYYSYLESGVNQATLGKRMMGLAVVDLAGNRISFPMALVRYFSKFLSAFILLLGYIMILFTDKRQGLHDKIAGTLVIKKEI